MSAAWMMLLVLGAAPQGGATGNPVVAAGLQAEAPLVPARTGKELEDATRESLRRWARPDDQEADAAAREFLVLYSELQRDTSIARTSREQLRQKVRSRLAALAQQISRREAKEKRQPGGDRPESVLAAESHRPLAQWGGLGAQQGAWAGGGVGMPGFSGQGPGNGAAGGGPWADDSGEQLVEVIQRTIVPHSWDVNGGPGSIYYWRPGRALVVRATGEVHDNVGNLLGQLQRAGQ